MTQPTSLVIPIEQVAWLAYQGFKTNGIGDAVLGHGNVAKARETVATAVAIAVVESGLNAKAHNGNASTGDDSYGLWQINMLGSLKAGRLALFGITSNEALYDPLTNAQAMAKLWRNKGGSFRDWSTYKDGKYKAHLADATKAVANMKPWATGQGEVDTIVGGEIGKAASAIFGPIFDFVKEIGLRIAGFVGGGLLLILAIILYVRSQS